MVNVSKKGRGDAPLLKEAILSQADESFLREFAHVFATLSSQGLSHQKMEPAGSDQFTKTLALVRRDPSFDCLLSLFKTRDGEPLATVASFMHTTEIKSVAAFGFLSFNSNFVSSTQQETSFSMSQVLDRTKEFGKEKGQKFAIGPINFSIWLSYRLKVSGFDVQYPWEPWGSPDFLSSLKSIKLNEVHSYRSEFYPLNKQLMKKHLSDHQRVMGGGVYEVIPVGSQRISEDLTRTLYRITTESFSGSSDVYDKLPYPLFHSVYVPQVVGSNTSCSFLCRLKENEVNASSGRDTSQSEKEHSEVEGSPPDTGDIVAYVYGFIDKTGEKPVGVVKTIAVDPAHRRKGISNALFHAVLQTFERQGVETVCSALMKDGVISGSYSSQAELKEFHKYALFKYDF